MLPFLYTEGNPPKPQSQPVAVPLSDIDSDSPIQTPTEDRFGVDHFAQLIAKSIAAQAGAEGTVIAVTAPWGGGKSSVINLTEYHLQETYPGIQVIRFNPWWFAGSEALAQAFMSTLACALGRSLGSRGKEAIGSFVGRMTKIETYKGAAVKFAEDGTAQAVASLLFGARTIEEEHSALSRALKENSHHIIINRRH